MKKIRNRLDTKLPRLDIREHAIASKRQKLNRQIEMLSSKNCNCHQIIKEYLACIEEVR